METSENRASKWAHLALVGAAGCAFAATLALPSLAEAQVTLPRQEIEDEIEEAMECYRNPDCASDSKPDCPLYWQEGDRVQVSRKNKTTLYADIRMKCEINNWHNPDVNVHLDLGFSCLWSNPSVRVSPAYVSIDVNWPWWVDVYTATITWWKGNIESRTATSKFRASGAVQDFTEERMVPLSYCPGIEVQSNGDVAIDLAMGQECSDGQRRHRSCPSGTHGPGIDDVCVGGRWSQESRDCEPNKPPGGSPL
ncbi:MAG: hypothetical protein ACREV1_00195 [Gammaproteobacteria bacterium]